MALKACFEGISEGEFLFTDAPKKNVECENKMRFQFISPFICLNWDKTAWPLCVFIDFRYGRTKYMSYLEANKNWCLFYYLLILEKCAFILSLCKMVFIVITSKEL